MPKKPQDLSGVRFGDTVARQYIFREMPSGRRGMWRCRCDCGREHIAHGIQLRQGRVTRCEACGIARKTTHQASRRDGKRWPEYGIWAKMKARCSNHKDPKWKDYGGRGISVCSRWQSFEAFIADMGRRPSHAHSIEREDNDGDYEPNNCYWATRRQQARNRHRRDVIYPREYVLGMLSCLA